MFTIEDLSKGNCAVINDGTLEELREVLKLAFPNDKTRVDGNYKNYYKSQYRGWVCTMGVSLPTQSVKDFLNTELKRGDLVWVNDKNPDERDLQLILLTKVDGAKHPFICVEQGDESLFHDGLTFETTKYKYATKVKEVCMTVEEIEKALGITDLKVVKK